MRSDFYSLPWAAQQAIRRGERNAHAASARLHTIEELQAAIVAQSDTITRLQAALDLMPDEIEVFRLIRGAHGNSHAVMAKAVARRIEEIRSSVGGE